MLAIAKRWDPRTQEAVADGLGTLCVDDRKTVEKRDNVVDDWVMYGVGADSTADNVGADDSDVIDSVVSVSSSELQSMSM